MIKKELLDKTYDEAKKAGFKGSENDFNDYKRILKEGIENREKFKNIDVFKLNTTKIINHILELFYSEKNDNHFEIFDALFNYCVNNNVDMRNKKVFQNYILRRKEVDENGNNIIRSKNTTSNIWKYI